ncbi:Rhamnan synthesis protein F [Paracoccus solventivorans]|uniref:Rhamnan synthesis protein F n=1 Tax=Paracoccus solventivorans TaxID=53463 RepID=A0A1M7GL02_9RHOB|nr:rhamnan synthesis F family protein [Paracoccus solventivorans]SHM16856.1 Rhamnan synthesis protein F [Paracoccus solventivorans]
MADLQKIKRELARPFKQLARNFFLPARRVGGSLRRIRYDANRKKNIRVTEGVQAAGREIAVLLIYQPQGVLESTYFTLSYLAEQGVSTIVVSNAPLADDDRERLAANSCLVIERPNVGYDFGGYREGILTVLERRLQPEALYVLNDSIWFPLRSDSDTIEQCREASEDVFGLKANILRKRRGCRSILHSFFYRFSAKVVASTTFCDYWKNMALINHKPTVIEEFEFKLAEHFRHHGFTVGSVINPSKVTEYLTNLRDGEKLRQILRYQMKTFPSQSAFIQNMLDQDSLGLPVNKQIPDAIQSHGIFTVTYTLHPWISQALGSNFVKKSNPSDMKAKRVEIRRLGLHRSYHPTVRDEIERWDTLSDRQH